MSNQSLGNAFSQRFKQEADIRHIAHHLFRGASVYGVEIAHRGGEEDVVKRFGKFFGVYYAQRALKLGQVVLCLHGSVLLSVGFDFVFILCHFNPKATVPIKRTIVALGIKLMNLFNCRVILYKLKGTSQEGYCRFLHGSVLLSVKFCNLLRIEIDGELAVVCPVLADAPVGEGDAFLEVGHCPCVEVEEDGVAYAVSAQHVLHVMERHVVLFCDFLQVGQTRCACAG